MKRQLVQEDKVAFMEQLEDLGKTKQDRVHGHSPGSMWQFPQHEELLASQAMRMGGPTDHDLVQKEQ